MRASVFDSSIYISALRQGDSAVLALRTFTQAGFVWLSAVVLEELYAGARNRRAITAVERLQRDFSAARRMLVPSANDWAEAGRALSHLAAKYDYESVGQGRLTNDALIAVSAARIGATVVTANARDFASLSEVRPFSWRLQATA